MIVEIAAADGAERVLASGGRNVTPAWSPDGSAVLFASDREDGRFKLYAVSRAGDAPPDARPGVVLDAPGGVLWPDIASDRRTIVFTSLTADGYDVFSARVADRADAPATLAAPASGTRHDGGLATALRRPRTCRRAVRAGRGEYSPWRTLLPRQWSPLVNVSGDDVGVGAMTGATDVLGYHEYSASVVWRAVGPGRGLRLRRHAHRLERQLRVQPLEAVAAALRVVRHRHDPRRGGGFVEDAGVPGTQPGVLRGRARSVAPGPPRAELARGGERRRAPPAGSTGVANRFRNGVRAGWALNSSRQYRVFDQPGGRHLGGGQPGTRHHRPWRGRRRLQHHR